MRREEISRLTWDNVDMGKRSAHLPKTKNGEARTVPLSPDALEVMREVLAEEGNNGWVFCMSPDAITQAMERARNAARITNLTFHDLRHEAISRLFENTDLDVMEIKTISGHRSMQMLARYSHLRAHRLADRLAGAKRGSENTAS
jgi:integrase